MTPRSSSIFMYFNVLGRLALIARGSGHNQTSVALVCHLLVHGRSIWDVGWGTYFFFSFPGGSIFRGFIFLFQARNAPSGYRNNILLADPE